MIQCAHSKNSLIPIISKLLVVNKPKALNGISKTGYGYLGVRKNILSFDKLHCLETVHLQTNIYLIYVTSFWRQWCPTLVFCAVFLLCLSSSCVMCTQCYQFRLDCPLLISLRYSLTVIYLINHVSARCSLYHQYITFGITFLYFCINDIPIYHLI